MKQLLRTLAAYQFCVGPGSFDPDLTTIEHDYSVLSSAV